MSMKRDSVYTFLGSIAMTHSAQLDLEIATGIRFDHSIPIDIAGIHGG